MASPIKNVIVIGASGSVGPSIVTALLDSSFTVSVLTRTTSSSVFPDGVKVYRTDYTKPSLLSAFEGQDAVVSTIATFSTHLQASIIDAAVEAGVKRFIPSEFGIDTSLPQVATNVPPAIPKQTTVQYLREQEAAGLSWTAVCVGAFFDWAFQYPTIMGWDLPGRKAVIFDGGDVAYEATNVAQIGRAVAAVLSAAHLSSTKNQYVYVNSFTLTQNKVLAVLERLTDQKFQVEHKSTKEVVGLGLDKLNSQKDETKMVSRGGGQYAEGSMEVIIGAIYGFGDVNNFSKNKGLWNDKLGVPQEDFEETLARVVCNKA